MDEFELNPDASTDGTWKHGDVLLSPRGIVERFGPPRECDGYKVSGTYTFTDKSGGVYTLYDWKVTSLFGDYDEQPDAQRNPTPEEFWSGVQPELLMIGAGERASIASFKRWLLREVD